MLIGETLNNDFNISFQLPGVYKIGSILLTLHLSFRLSVRPLSRNYLEIGSLVFPNFGLALETHMKFCIVEPFLGGFFKIGFFLIHWKISSFIFSEFGL